MIATKKADLAYSSEWRFGCVPFDVRLDTMFCLAEY